MKGTIIIYQGEECGFEESEVPHEKMLDPYGIYFYPKFKGRDGCRTPLAWTFENREMWLPIEKSHLENNIESQASNPESVYHFCKELINLRKDNLELFTYGEISIEEKGQKIHIKRSQGKKKMSLLLDLESFEFEIT